MSRRPRRHLSLLATFLLALGLVGCGSAHRVSTTTQTTPVAGGGTVGLTFATGGEPGLRLLKLTLPKASVTLTPQTDTPGSALGHDKLSHEISTAPSGTVIHLASGVYPELLVTKQRPGWVTVSGAGDVTKPVMPKAKLFGATHVRFADVDFGKLHINQSPGRNAAHPAADIQVLDSEVDCAHHGHGAGITVRNGAGNIVFDGDYVHNCSVGFASVAQDIVSDNVSITHCLFENFYGDAIDIGAMHDLTIADDVVRLIAHMPGHKYHDDGIQFFGNTSDTLIEDDVLANSNDQLLFIQDAVKSKETHSSVNARVAVIGNLIYGAGAIAVQDQGCLDCQFVGNTIWAGHDGCLLIRKSGYTNIDPTHTLVVDNVLEQYSLIMKGSPVQAYNVFVPTAASNHDSGAHDVITKDVGLEDPRQGSFAPTGSSPARGSAAPKAVLLAMARQADVDPGVLALLAGYGAKDRGALAYHSAQPGYGVPFTLTDRNLRGGLRRHHHHHHHRTRS